MLNSENPVDALGWGAVLANGDATLKVELLVEALFCPNMEPKGELAVVVAGLFIVPKMFEVFDWPNKLPGVDILAVEVVAPNGEPTLNGELNMLGVLA